MKSIKYSEIERLQKPHLDKHTSVLLSLQIPTLAVYGEDDLGIGLSGIQELSYMGNKYAYMIPDAGHIFYISKTRMFHQILYNFLEALPSNYI